MEDPFFSVAPVARRIQDHPLDLYNLGFMFATSQIKPSVGRLKVEFIQHHIKDDGEKKKTYNEIEMVKCSELFPGGKYEEFNNNS